MPTGNNLGDELVELAERIESATEPDRELDARIEAARRGEDYDALFVQGYAPEDWNAAPFTASLDAAMTLVPEGLEWLARSDDCGGFANVTGKDFQSIVEISGGETFNRSTGLSAPSWAATPALALCAASLKARAQASQIDRTMDND